MIKPAGGFIIKWSSVIVLALSFAIFISLAYGVNSVAHASSVRSVYDLAGYSYLKSHQIAGSQDGALNDFQVKFVVHSGDGPDNGQDVYLMGDSKSWPDDFRFTDSSDNLLPYWIESFDAEAATVWVKVNRIAAWPAMTTLKIYYGKARVTGASNGLATFVLFEDFSDDSRRTTVWSESTGDALNSYPSVHVFENGGYHIRQDSPKDTGARLTPASPLNTATWCGVTLQDISEHGSRSPPWILPRVGYGGNDWSPGYWGNTQGGYDTLPGHTYQLSWTDGRTANNVQLYENGALLSTSSGTFTAHRPDIGVRTASDAMGEWYFRDFYARAYTPNPPVHGNWDSRETANSADTWTAYLPFICCGGCLCGTIVILLLVLIAVILNQRKKTRRQ